MNTSIKVSQKLVDGIEYYVSNDGYTGISQRGLARLCGVDEKSIRILINRFGADLQLPECLKCLPSKDLWFVVEAENNAEVIPSVVCAGIIEYYTFESKAKNYIAKYSFRKFSKVGIDAWIKEITGYVEQNNNNNEVLNCLRLLMDDVKELKQDIKAYHNLKANTSTVFTNLDTMLETFEEDSLTSDNAEELTVTEWLMKYHKLQFNNAARRSFSLLVSQTYESIKGAKPKKINKINDTGKPSNGVSVYHESEFPILQLCLNKVIFNSSATLN